MRAGDPESTSCPSGAEVAEGLCQENPLGRREIEEKAVDVLIFFRYF